MTGRTRVLRDEPLAPLPGAAWSLFLRCWCAGVGGGARARSLVVAFMGNPAVNGVILGILLAGIVYIFRQVLLLDPEIDWIEIFRDRLADARPDRAAGRRRACWRRWRACWARGSAAGSACRRRSLHTLLDGIASRLDETRETSRYLIGAAGLSRPARHVLRPAGDGALGRRRDRRARRRRRRCRRAPSPT